MIVITRTLEIVGLFSALGLPLNLLLLPRTTGPHKVCVRLLLAPATGLAMVVAYTGWFFAIRRPVVAGLPFIWFLATALWMAAGADLWRRHALRRNRVSIRTTLLHGLTLLCLFMVMGCYLWPFWQRPDLVFWHYAGTDGYGYMRIAEHVANPGTAVVPAIGPYDAASGFLAMEMRNFHSGVFTDKPGTMSALAGVAGLLGITTHEAFSPLVIESVGTLHLVLVVFAQSLLRLPLWASLVFASLGALAPPVWMLTSHTFLGNVLALPFYPLILLMVRSVATWRTAVLFGLFLAEPLLAFPDGTLALIFVGAVAAPSVLWDAARHKRLGRLTAASLIAVATTGAIISPYGQRLFVGAYNRLADAVPANLGTALRMGVANTAVETLTIEPQAKLDWIWGALNLNVIPPEPLRSGEVPYLVALCGFLALFVVASVWRKTTTQMFFYLIGFALLLAVGAAGFLKSDYELFRALAIFTFLPLAALCRLPWLIAGERNIRWAPHVRAVLIIAIVPLLAHFIQTDAAHFRFGYDQHAPDAQYTIDNLRDRREISRLGGPHTLVLTSETGSFTAMANVIMLFSTAKIGLPAAYHRGFFFSQITGADRPYASDLVIRNLRYGDVAARSSSQPALYASSDFEVVENDLQPFFDNVTFPVPYPFPLETLQKLRYPVVRTLSQRTEVPFFNREARVINVDVHFGVAELPAELSYAFDGGAPQRAPIDSSGRVLLAGTELERGLHRLSLGPLPRPAQVTAIRIYGADGERMTAVPKIKS